VGLFTPYIIVSGSEKLIVAPLQQFIQNMQVKQVSYNEFIRDLRE
tara:strand:+ start:128 stop:262 length:135 start_codon:yes stop_codon:yes gene_type:complete